jgi:predicted O-linked N-acetylglucosamine transferase (SPINDLY family)
MSAIAELFEAAVQLHRTGQLPQALQRYQEVLQQQPQHAGALNLIGVVACQMGNLTEGIAAYQQALAVQPNFADAHYNLALALQLVGRGEAAIVHYQSALALQAHNPEAHNNLGNLLAQRGNLEVARHHYRQALRLRPDYASAEIGLGRLLAQQGRTELAIAHFQRAIQLQPNQVGAYHALAQVLNQQGRMDEALPYLQTAVRIQPHPQIYYALAKTLEEQGNVEAAIGQFQATLQQLPNCPEAFWHQQLLLPILYDTPEQIAPYRQRFCRGLNHLIHQIDLTTPAGRQSALTGLGSRTNFYLAYQGLNDRGLQRKYGQLLHRIMAANFPQWAQPFPLPALHNGKIRIGYLSAHLMAHSAGAWARGWIRERDRDRFEVYCYHIGEPADWMTQEFQSISDRFRHIPGKLEAICQQVLADQLHILIFTDIGMDPQTSQLAGLRLAPVQCTAWGHPVTSGIPTIDYYLSSDLMEPENAQQHYTEQLIRLPQIGICYAQPSSPSVVRSRTEFGLRQDATLYLSFQSPYKYLPQFDCVFAQIAQRVPQAQFLFLRHHSACVVERFQRRMQCAFAKLGLNSTNYCLFLPKLDRDRFWSLNQVCDVALDALEWSGGNSTLEAIAFGLPVVTLAGQFMRGRHSTAMLQRSGVTETIAHTPAEYVEIAARLGLDLDWRRSISARLQAGHDRLYDDRECVRALEAFFTQVVESAS